MRRERAVAHGVGAVLIGLGLVLRCAIAAEHAAAPPKRDAKSTEAAILVRQALEAEAAGKPGERAAFLKRAVEIDPDYAPAHWHAGEVRLGSRWLSVDEASKDRARAGKIAQYRKRPDRLRTDIGSQLRLARWCADNGLAEQERLHLYFAYMLNPDTKSKQLTDRLGLVRYGDRLVPQQWVNDVRKNEQQTAKALGVWLPQIEEMAADLDIPDVAARAVALERLGTIEDPLAIPALETLSAQSPPDVVLAVVESLKRMPQQAATDSLVRHALFASDQDVRDAATEGLKVRSPFGYMPVLMGALTSPVHVRFESTVLGGQPGHMLTLMQEGPYTVQAMQSSGAASVQRSKTIYDREKVTINTLNYTPDVALSDDLMLAAMADAHNKRATALNERIFDILRTATGMQLGLDPNPWWDYWYSYNEVYRPPYKLVSQSVRTFTPPPPGENVSHRHSLYCISCFVAGTPVWTMTGPMPIERIPIGECILAQDPATGELAYKPVLATTVRPASPVIAVTAGGHTIHATRGHPFWVSGKGWRMTKELHAGDALHTANGPVTIDSLTPSGQAVCYNLVVADFNSYFIGQRQVLVHDNNIRDVTPAIVPGLLTQ